MLPALLTRLSLRHPFAAAALLAAATLVLGLGIPRLQRETTLRTFLGPLHPTVRTLDAHVATFGGGYPVVIAYGCDETPLCDSVFDPAALEMAAAVTRDLETAFGVHSVHGPADAPLLVGSDGDIGIRRLVEADDAGVARIAPDRVALAERAVSDPLWQRVFVARQGAVGAIVLELASSAADVQRGVASAIEEALAPHREAGWHFHLVGELVDFVYAGIEVERDSRAMVPTMGAVLFVVLLALLRNPAFALCTVGGMGIAFVWTQGAMGWAQVKLNAVTTVTPSIVFAIGILDGVHLVTRFAQSLTPEARADPELRRSLLLEIARDVGPACALTSLTTIGAFGAFLASGIASFAEFGVVAAFGVGVALLLTFTLLPIVLARLPARWLPRGRGDAPWDALLDATLGSVRRRRVAILVVAGLVAGVCAVGVARVRIEIDPGRLVGETNRLARWNQWVAQNLRATESLEIALSLPPGASIHDPAVLDRVGEIERFLERDVSSVAHPRSLRGLLGRVNRILHEGDPAFAMPARSRRGNAQLAMLLAWSDRSALDRFAVESQAAGGTSLLRISAEAESISTPLQARLVADVTRHLRDVLPPDHGFALTGSVPMYLEMMTALQRNQLRCFGLAAIAVLLLMGIALRSVGLALLAFVPSVLPCLATVGLMGLWDVGLDPASTMVATIILGVAVDDGIHLLTRYARERRAGHAPASAIDASVRHVGRAVIVSSGVLAAAFASLTLSPAASVATFGFLAALSIVVALAADLWLLPALVLTLAGRGTRARVGARAAGSARA